MNHLNLRDRVTIQYYIEYEKVISLKQCAQLVRVNPSTIYHKLKNRSPHSISKQKRFIKKHRGYVNSPTFSLCVNCCNRRLYCSISIVFYDAYETDMKARKLRVDSRSKPKLILKGHPMIDCNKFVKFSIQG